ncbi:MAG: monofunctional biosynthetic peptidoglycan transglycosylase [Pseudomonadota bacterium]
MARTKPRKGTPPKGKRERAPKRGLRASLRRVLIGALKVTGIAFGVIVLSVLLLRVINPPGGYYMVAEYLRRGEIARGWAGLDEMPRHMPLAAMAAEDANFCDHYGFDVEAIQKALEANSQGRAMRGASTISQQVAKNLFLWPERSWLRKGVEVGFTGLIEVFWPKRRIVEVYLNIAEFDDGVFGAEAAARHYFAKPVGGLSEVEAARLAAILPSPKKRSASRPGPFTRSRARAIVSGMRTLSAEGRDACLD